MSHVIIRADRRIDKDRMSLLCAELRDHGIDCWIDDSEPQHRLQCHSEVVVNQVTRIIWNKLLNFDY